MADTPLAVDKLVAVTTTITQEVTVHIAVVAVADAPQGAVALLGYGVAAQSTAHAY